MASHPSAPASGPGAQNGKGMWRQVARPERQEQMLEAAMKLFADRGFANVSMDAVAAETGITKPLVYSYFGSKEGLYVACIRRFHRPLEQALLTVGDAGLPPERWLWEGALAAFGFIGAHRQGWKRFFLEPMAHGDEAAAVVEELRERAVGQVSEMFGRGIRDAGLALELDIESEIPSQVYILVGGVESLARWWVAHPDQATAETLALRLVNHSWLGFGDLLEGRLWLPPSTPPGKGTP